MRVPVPEGRHAPGGLPGRACRCPQQATLAAPGLAADIRHPHQPPAYLTRSGWVNAAPLPDPTPADGFGPGTDRRDDRISAGPRHVPMAAGPTASRNPVHMNRTVPVRPHLPFRASPATGPCRLLIDRKGRSRARLRLAGTASPHARWLRSGTPPRPERAATLWCARPRRPRSPAVPHGPAHRGPRGACPPTGPPATARGKPSWARSRSRLALGHRRPASGLRTAANCRKLTDGHSCPIATLEPHSSPG